MIPPCGLRLLPVIRKKIPFLCLLLFMTFSSSAMAGDHMIQAKVDDFDAGAGIHVCWRLVKPGNPFLVSGPFDCQATVVAVDAPFPGGGINGDQLMAVVHKTAGAKPIKEIRVRALTEGQDAADQGANLMTVDPGASEFYNSYVGRDSNGRLVIFLDIEIKE